MTSFPSISLGIVKFVIPFLVPNIVISFLSILYLNARACLSAASLSCSSLSASVLASASSFSFFISASSSADLSSFQITRPSSSAFPHQSSGQSLGFSSKGTLIMPSKLRKNSFDSSMWKVSRSISAIHNLSIAAPKAQASLSIQCILGYSDVFNSSMCVAVSGVSLRPGIIAHNFPSTSNTKPSLTITCGLS